MSKPDVTMEALHARIAAVLGPRRKQLAEAVMAEIEQQALDQMAEHFVNETRIRSMDFRNGASMDVEPARELVAHWVAAARAMLGDAPNYSETEIDFGREDPPGYEMEIKLAGELDRYVFRVQRRGKLTPHQARKLAEERAERAEARLAAIREYRALIDDDGEQVVLIGPCAETIGCLFSRAYDSPTLGQLVDAATEHDGEQGEQAHAHVAEMAAGWDRAAAEYNEEHGHA